MSIVAHQYNILAETLRRGLAGFQEGKLQEAKLGMMAEKQKFDIEMGHKQMQLQEAANTRAQAAEERAQELHGSQVASAKANEQMLTQKAKMFSDEYNQYVQKKSTYLNKDNFFPLFGTHPSLSSPEFAEDVLNQAKDLAGITFDEKTGEARKNGQRISLWDAERDPAINGGFAFVDWEQFMKGMYRNMQGVVGDPQNPLMADPKARKDIYDKMGQLEKSLQKIESNRPAYERRRTDAMLQAMGKVKDPTQLAAMQKALDVQLAREKSQSVDSKNIGLKDMTYTLPDGTTVETKLTYDKTKGWTLEDALRAKNAGYGDPEKPMTMDKYRVGTLQQYTSGGYESLDKGQRVVMDNMLKDIGSNRLMSQVEESMRGDIEAMGDKYQQWHDKTLYGMMRRAGDWNSKAQILDYLANYVEDEDLEREGAYVRDFLKRQGW